MNNLSEHAIHLFLNELKTTKIGTKIRNMVHLPVAVGEDNTRCLSEWNMSRNTFDWTLLKN